MNLSLEYDLFKTPWIAYKCQANPIYAQNLYAALCNNRFFKDNNEWTCSWRHAGSIIADLRSTNEDYMDWYCSGISSQSGYVCEGDITPEINNDLLNLGWTTKHYEPRLNPGLYRNYWQ